MIDSKDIRNIVLLGHSGSGKSYLKESILYNSIENNEKEFDYNSVENISSDTNVFSVNWKNHKYNFIDTPGHSDFYGETLLGTSVAEGAVVIVDGTTDIQVGTDKSLELTDKFNLPKIIFVNKIDSEKADYYKILDQLRERYGKKIAPFHVPIGKDEEFKGYVNVVELFAREYNSSDKRCYTVEVPNNMDEEINKVRELLMESIAETDEQLLDKYFSGEPFNKDEIHMGLRNAVMSGDVIPVLCGSTAKNIGVHTLMWLSKDYFPSPIDKNPEIIEKPFEGRVFKSLVDKFLGKVSILKANSGKLNIDDEIYNIRTKEKEKITKLMNYKEDELMKSKEVIAGDIAVIINSDILLTGDTLSTLENIEELEIVKLPKPQYFIALEPVGKNDEDRIKKGLSSLEIEDPALNWEINSETGQIIIGTLGEIHVDSVVNKLDKKFNVKVNLKEILIPYRETIKKKMDVQGRYKKQSGGHGQFGDVKIIFEPSTEHFDFNEKIVGGAIPKGYIPAVESGIKESMMTGSLKGYPVMNLKVTLYDGSYHNVDSSEYAFKAAANLAFKEALTSENSTILEPVMRIEITIPEDYTGTIMGDLNKKRGRVLGVDSKPNGKQKVISEIPQSEILDYAIKLTSMTGGRGFFELHFLRYEEVPKEKQDYILKK